MRDRQIERQIETERQRVRKYVVADVSLERGKTFAQAEDELETETGRRREMRIL